VSASADQTVPLRTQLPVYGVGLFANSMSDVGSVILPIWLASLGASPATIGLVIGVRHILPFFFAIHGGALMDRLGTKRLLAVSSCVSALMIFSFPLQEWLPLIIALQMVNGYGASMSWVGAQTAFGKLLNANPAYAGRFAFGLRMGSFIGPPMVGFAWDYFGKWGGFIFFGLWSLGAFASTMALPEIPGSRRGGPRPFRARDLLPRMADYRAALRLAYLPVMGTVLVVTMLRVAASSIQDSFYPIYLQSIGLSATEIGLLVTVSSFVAAFAALTVGPLAHLVRPVWLLIWSGMGSVLFVAITPLQHSFLPLAVVAACRGVCMGVSQPLMLSILANAAGVGSLGVGAALRTTANRLSAGLTPIAMGYTAHVFGLEESFLITGAVLMAGMVVVAITVARNQHLADDEESGRTSP
jgi:DHA1 family multidrug resistance protein-like MFS transporter